MFNAREWEMIQNWTAESEDQDEMLACGPSKVTPGLAVAILVEITAEGGMEDKEMVGVVRKLGELISQL
jgi:hypothetical protein